MIPQLKSIFNQNQLTSLINLLTQNVNALIAGKENVSNKQNSLAPDVTNTKYPTVTAVNTGLALKLNLTGGTMSGAIAMGTNKITGLGNPSSNQDAATKFYVDTITNAVSTNATDYTDSETANAVTYANAYTDTEVATKQNLFDYSGAATATSSVTIDNKKGGVATFTRVIPAKDCRTLTLNSNFILSTSKIIPVLVYKSSGDGFPVILSQAVVAGKVDFIIANLDADGSGGLDTNDSLLIQYQIVG
jgi:hypothetical protein